MVKNGILQLEKLPSFFGIFLFKINAIATAHIKRIRMPLVIPIIKLNMFLSIKNSILV
jgi:hypothetical protein